MSNSITNRQIFFILFVTLTTYTTIDLPQAMAQSAGRSSWIAIIFTSIVFGIAAVIITKLNNMFMGKVMFDYSQEIVGKFFAYVIGIYFFIYFLSVGVYLKLKFVGLLQSNFMPKTPAFVVLLFGITLFAFASYKGITNVARLLELYGFGFLVVTVILCFLMIVHGTTNHILPIFDASEAGKYLKTLEILVLPYGGIELLLIIPFSLKNKKGAKTAFFTLVFIGLFYVLVVESTIMALGINNTKALNDSFIEAIKVTDAPIIERIDIFYLTFGLASLFSGMIIVFTGVLEFACKLFKKVKRSIITIVIGVVFFILCLFAMGIKDINEIYEKFATYSILVSAILIPTTLFILAKIKQRKKKKAA